MRLCTWNLGLYSRFAYADRIGYTYAGHRIPHEYFQRFHVDAIVQELHKQKPDIVVLQEIYTEDDARYLHDALGCYPYSQLINTRYHDHAILILSMYPITIISEGVMEHTFVVSGGLVLIPVHLHSFSAALRKGEVDALVHRCDAHQLLQPSVPLCVLGDTNFWSQTRRGLFLYAKDRIAYDTLCHYLSDATTRAPSTHAVGMTMDKIFLSSAVRCDRIRVGGCRPRYMDHYPVYSDITIPGTYVL